MTHLLFFLLGGLVACLMMQKPLKIEINNNIKELWTEPPKIDMNKLEEKMLKEDPKSDQLYDDFDKTLQEVNEIMGGSDR